MEPVINHFHQGSERGGPRTFAWRLGGAPGYTQFVKAGGKISLPPNESIRLPAGGAVAVASGTEAAFYKEATVDGTHLRIYTARLDRQTAIEIARPLTEVDHALSRIRLLFLLVSFAAIIAMHETMAQIGSVFTPPEHRRRGLSRAVMTKVMRDARLDQQLDKLFLFTGEENAPARRLYESLGFESFGHFGLFFGE